MILCHHDECYKPVRKLIQIQTSQKHQYYSKRQSLVCNDLPIQNRYFITKVYAYCDRHLNICPKNAKITEWKGLLLPLVSGIPKCMHAKCYYSSTKYFQFRDHLFNCCQFHVAFGIPSPSSFDEISLEQYNKVTIERIMDQ